MELRVLVIDDDAIFNLMTDAVLRNIGITAHPKCFTCGQEALTYIIQENNLDITYLVFLDINMPTISGWEVLGQLQQLPIRHRIHVVMVTSSIDRADKNRASEFEQVIDYMVKPLKREKLATLKQHKKIVPFFS